MVQQMVVALLELGEDASRSKSRTNIHLVQQLAIVPFGCFGCLNRDESVVILETARDRILHPTEERALDSTCSA